MADCGREGTGYTGYKIWLRRSDTHRRITDTNIWVGNIHIPKDAPYCKISSGKTNGECWAYVEFNTWDDLLRSIGVEPETVNIELDGELFQEDTEKTKVYLEFDGELEQVDGEKSRNITLGGAIVQTNDETAIGIKLGGTIIQTGEPPAPPYLEIEATPSGNVPYTGGRKTLSITSNTNWSISTNVSWILIEGGYAGENNDTRTIVVDPRDSGYSVRSGDVTVSGGGLRRQATIKQEGGEPPEPTYLEITVTPSGNVPYSGGRKTLSISSNTSWSISSNVPWISIEGGYSGVNNDTRTIVVDPRDSGYAVRSGEITVSGGGIRKQATIEQDGQELVNVEIDGELTQE